MRVRGVNLARMSGGFIKLILFCLDDINLGDQVMASA